MNGKGILIVSENQGLLKSVTECLRQMEFDVVTCREGLQRNDFFKASCIKGILLDLEMSGNDGVSMLKHLRKLHPTVPIIALSIHENVMGLVRAVEEGATDYMIKPIDPHNYERSARWYLIKGLLKKSASGVLGSLSCSRTTVRSARQSPCGLAGRAFLNSPFPSDK